MAAPSIATHSSTTPDGGARQWRRRGGQEWLLWACLLLAAATVLAVSHNRRLANAESREADRLTASTRVLALNLSHQLRSAQASLRGLRDDFSAGVLSPETAAAPLRTLRRAWPGGVAHVDWVDARGRVLASSEPERVGRDVADGEAFKAAAAPAADPDRLVVAPPRGPDAPALQLALRLPAAAGQPRGGLLQVALDPAFFATLLGSVNETAGMWSALAHGSGRVLVFAPARPESVGTNIDRPGSMFARHVRSGRPVSVFSGTTLLQPVPQLVVQRSVGLEELPLQDMLVLAVSKPLEQVLAPARTQSAVYVVLLAVAAAGSALGLMYLQRSRAAHAAVRQAQTAQAEFLALALRGGDLGLWEADLRLGTGRANDRWYEMLGLKPGALTPDASTWASLIHPDERACVVAAQEAHIRGETPAFEQRYRLRHTAGHWVWVLDRGCVVEHDATGRALRMAGTHLDITEAVEREQALRESEQNLAVTLQSIGDAVLATDREGRVTRLNPAAERLTGWAEAESRGRPLTEVFHIVDPQTGTPATDPVRQVLDSGEVVAMANDTLLLARDGARHHIADSAAPIRTPGGEVIGVVLVFSDVSERYRAVQALREREHQLSIISDSLPGPVLQVDLAHRVRFVNAAFERWHGQPAQAVLGKTLSELMSEQALAHIRPYLERVHAGETVEFVNHVATRHGMRDALVTLVPDREPDGPVRGHFAVLTDITESRQTDLKLRQVRDELAATLAAVPDLLFDVDLEGCIHGQHSPRHDLLAAAPEAFIGQRLENFVPAEAALVVRKALAQAHASGYSGGLQYELPLPGGVRWFELSVSRKPPPEGRAEVSPRFIVLARDITERHQAEGERRALERQLREVQKMESIGTLAGGIAHDFNNILAAILGNVDLAGDDLPDGHPARASLDQIRKASLRARALVQQILTFSRRMPQQTRVQPLRPVLEEALALLRATLPAGVQLQARLGDEPLHVQAEPTQLQQVLINLCTNAWQALPEGGGRIEVGLRRCPAGELPAVDSVVAIGPAEPEHVDHAHFWVADNGLGMDEALRERIFDPFFTTKPVGQGTGLGLSVVHGIVRSHGGGIGVHSRPGEGSVFHVWLPLARADGEPGPAPAPALPLRPDGQGRAVLYVDDDEVMVLMVQRLLQRAGYRVDTCASAAEALARVLAAEPSFDAVVTDFNMPGQSGLELARQLQAQVPGLPVLISSGYLSDDLRAQAGAAGVRALMKKENTLEELAGLLQQVLGSKG